MCWTSSGLGDLQEEIAGVVKKEAACKLHAHGSLTYMEGAGSIKLTLALHSTDTFSVKFRRR